MTRTTTSRKRPALQKAKSYFGMSNGIRKMTLQRLEKSWQYATEHRRKNKRAHRSIWIQRINAATREHNISYSKFMHGLKKEKIYLNRRVLAEIAIHEPFTFLSLVSIAKNSKIERVASSA